MKSLDGISAMLRRIRLEKGMSLAEVARRADTSAASLSRYEHGWTRFEVYTLNKLASALGCELSINLRSRSRTQGRNMQSTAVRRLSRLFWDTPLTERVMEQHPVWVVERVLDYGTLEDLRTLLTVFGRNTFLGHVARAARVSPRTRAFWDHMLKKEGLPCMKKYSRNTPWNS